MSNVAHLNTQNRNSLIFFWRMCGTTLTNFHKSHVWLVHQNVEWNEKWNGKKLFLEFRGDFSGIEPNIIRPPFAINKIVWIKHFPKRIQPAARRHCVRLRRFSISFALHCSDANQGYIQTYIGYLEYGQVPRHGSQFPEDKWTYAWKSIAHAKVVCLYRWLRNLPLCEPSLLNRKTNWAHISIQGIQSYSLRL